MLSVVHLKGGQAPYFIVFLVAWCLFIWNLNWWNQVHGHGFMPRVTQSAKKRWTKQSNNYQVEVVLTWDFSGARFSRMRVLCRDKPFGKIQSPPERKGMYLFDLKTVWKVLGKLPCQVIKWNNHVIFCHYDMLNVWWKSNMAWKCWIEWLQRWKRHHSLHTTKVPISHADIIFWHQRTAQKSKSPFRVWVWKCRTKRWSQSQTQIVLLSPTVPAL